MLVPLILDRSKSWIDQALGFCTKTTVKEVVSGYVLAFLMSFHTCLEDSKGGKVSVSKTLYRMVGGIEQANGDGYYFLLYST